MSPAKPFWKTIPGRLRVVFLLGVFCIFSTFRFASDISEMGREPTLHFVLSVFLSGLFSTSYALTGFILRKQLWKAFVPLFAIHYVLMGVLGYWLPARPQPAQMDAADIAQLHGRLAIDAIAIIVAVALGYACFLYATITEGRRYFRVHAEIELAMEIHRDAGPDD